MGPSAGGGSEVISRPVADLAVRPRSAVDLPDLLSLLARSHAEAGYPVRASAVSAQWLATADELVAAVATLAGRVVGHVALHPADPGSAAVTVWAEAAGRPVEALAVVSRLFTDGAVRGAGTLLLNHAVERAADLGRAPVLLVDPESAALDFYRRRGWREVGTATQQWGPRTVDAVLMVSPPRATAAGCPPASR